MEENGLVRSRWEDPDKRTRRIYQITDEGRQELERLRRVLRPEVMEAIEVLHVLYDELYGEDTGAPPASGAGESDQAPVSDTPSGTAAGPDVPPEPSTTANATAEDEASLAEAEQRAARWRERFGRLFGRGADFSTFGA